MHTWLQCKLCICIQNTYSGGLSGCSLASCEVPEALGCVQQKLLLTHKNSAAITMHLRAAQPFSSNI